MALCFGFKNSVGLLLFSFHKRTSIALSKVASSITDIDNKIMLIANNILIIIVFILDIVFIFVLKQIYKITENVINIIPKTKIVALNPLYQNIATASSCLMTWG
ncbi:hypothetical protein ACWXVO_02330 [Mycoplasma sp. 1890]